jgi:hypothetical protein
MKHFRISRKVQVFKELAGIPFFFPPPTDKRVAMFDHVVREVTGEI